MQTILLLLILSLDAFTASMAYGTNKIRIPFASAMVVNGIGAAFLGLSLGAAILVQNLIPAGLCLAISFTLLFLLGLSNLFQNGIKAHLHKKSDHSDRFAFRFSNIGFVLEVYLDETKADADHSQVLSCKEAIYLAIALSLDSLATGFGGGLYIQNPWLVVGLCLVVNHLAIMAGGWLGRRLARKENMPDMSWLGGAMLMMLAFLKII